MSFKNSLKSSKPKLITTSIFGIFWYLSLLTMGCTTPDVFFDKSDKFDFSFLNPLPCGHTDFTELFFGYIIIILPIFIIYFVYSLIQYFKAK